jgi:hypothetical protein
MAREIARDAGERDRSPHDPGDVSMSPRESVARPVMLWSQNAEPHRYFRLLSLTEWRALQIGRVSHSKALREDVWHLLSVHPGISSGQMFGCPAFFLGRRMVACIYGDQVGVKLPATRVEEVLAQADTEPFQPYGKSRMREWVAVRYRSGEPNAFAGLLDEAVAYASSQPK